MTAALRGEGRDDSLLFLAHLSVELLTLARRRGAARLRDGPEGVTALALLTGLQYAVTWTSVRWRPVRRR